MHKHFLALIAAAAALAAPPGESSGTTPGAGKLVFFPFDDVSVPWRDNLKVTMVRPRKHPGNPVFRPGPQGSVDSFGAILYGTVIHDQGKFRMWYLAWPQADSRIPGDTEKLKTHRPVAYAESADGIHWTRPNLGLVEFRGNRENNLVLIEPSSERYSRTSDFISVLLDTEDPDASRRYKMAYILEDEVCRCATTATATSPDGLRWKLANTTMITRGHFENTSLIRFNGLYYAGGQNFDPHGGHLMDGSAAGRVMTMFFSPDFKRWSTGRAVSFHRSDYTEKPLAYGQETHMGAGLWNRGNVILGLYGRWYGDTITGKPVRLAGLKMDLGLVVSNDAIHYREPVRNFVFLEHGKEHEWDSESLLQGNAFANTETETLIWYSHWYTSNPYPLPPLPREVTGVKPQGVGLATMRRDGFGYFSKHLTEPAVIRGTGERLPREASMMTAPVRLSKAARLYVNAEGLSANAPLKIEIVDDGERTVTGYSAVHASNGLRVEVPWPGRRKELPVGTPFRIKVSWPVGGTANLRLYALYVE